MCVPLTSVLTIAYGQQLSRTAPKALPPTRSAKPIQIRPIRLIAVGDVCLAQGVETEMDRHGRGFPFAAMKKTLRTADISFGNLECCLASHGQPVPKQYNFRGRPRGALALSEAGFTVVSLANNHSLDYGKVALAETVDNLEKQHVTPVGAGRTLADARSLRIITIRGVKVGFLAYLGLFPAVVPLREGEPGVAMADPVVIKREVEAARKKVDFLIVSVHAGKEYTFVHTARQAEIAHTAIDAGADLVIGHHPHVVQDVETYKGKQIFYSLGNFVFNPSPTFLRDGGKRWSAMVVADLTPGGGITAQIVELKIVGCQPRLVAIRK